MGSIYGNMVGAGSAPLKTIILEDPTSGVEIVGVVTDNEHIFDAVASKDIREGKTAVTSEGIVIGSKRIPAYETSRGYVVVDPDGEFKISILSDYDRYDYTQLQCIITRFDETIDNSVFSEKVVIDNTVYNVSDNVALANVTKDNQTKTIKLNIANSTNNIYLIRYFTYYILN